MRKVQQEQAATDVDSVERYEKLQRLLEGTPLHNVQYTFILPLLS
jgi:hypothetical protein